MLRKSTLIILALCLIVGGIGIGVTGAVLGGKTEFVFNGRGWNFIEYTKDDIEDNREYTKDNLEYKQDYTQGKLEELGSFKKIDVKSGTVAITIREGKTYGIGIDVGSKVELKYSIRGDTLYVEQDGRRINNNILGTNDWKKYGGEIIITVPEGKKLEKTYIELGVGEGKFENLYTENFKLVVGVADTYIQGLTADRVNIEGGVGRIILDEGYLGETDITVGVGSIKVETVLSGDLDIEGGLGDLDVILQGDEKDYNYEISRGMGKIRINDETYKGMDDINIRNKSDKTIDIEAGVGSISIETRIDK